MGKKIKEQLASLQEEIELLRTALQMHVSTQELSTVLVGGNCDISFEIRTACKEPEPDYHSAEALQELMHRMEDGVTYKELRKIFSDDLDTLVGWLNSFVYIGAWNGCMLDQEKLPEDQWVWDGCFEKRGEELWYTGGAGASGYGHAELLVKDDDLIVLF